MFYFHRIFSDNKLNIIPFLLIITVDCLALSFAILLAVFSGLEPTHFMEEGEPITWFSAGQLAAVGAIAAIVGAIRFRDRDSRKIPHASPWIWFFIATCFWFLGLDELQEIHESIDLWIHELLNIDQSHLSDRLDDLVILLYGAVMGFVLYKNKRELKQFRQVWKLLKVGIYTTIAMVILDAITNQNDIIASETINEWVGTVEECFKIGAEGILLSVSYYCLQIAKNFSIRSLENN
jgi:hypothetical protein